MKRRVLRPPRLTQELGEKSEHSKDGRGVQEQASDAHSLFPGALVKCESLLNRQGSTEETPTAHLSLYMHKNIHHTQQNRKQNQSAVTFI